MKNKIYFKVFSFLTLMMCSFIYSQKTYNTQLLGQVDRSYDLQINASGEKVVGSPFFEEKYENGSIGKISKPIRYNAYKDRIEYLDNGQKYVLEQNAGYNPIVLGDRSKLFLKEYIGKNGLSKAYLFLVYEKNNIAVFVKKNKKLVPGIKAVSSYEKDVLSSFEKTNEIYFLQINEGELQEISLTRKKFIELFPDKKDEINNLKLPNKLDKVTLINVVDIVAQ